MDAAITKDANNISSATAPARPKTLDIPPTDSAECPSPGFAPLQTPLFEELQPILRSDMEKILQHFKMSPQTPGSFLNPKHVTEEQEQFANAFTQKLNELKEQGRLSTIAANVSPTATVLSPGGLYSVNLADVDPKQLPTFAELCRQATQQELSSAPASILLYSPTTFDPRNITAAHQLTPALFGTSIVNMCNNSIVSSQLTGTSQAVLPGSVSITIPQTSTSPCAPGSTAIHLPVGLRIGITPSSIVQNTTLQQSVNDAVIIANSISQLSSNESSLPIWPLHVQTANVSASENNLPDGRSTLATASLGNDTRPSSVANSIDQPDSGNAFRSSSSASSTSSSPHNSNSKGCLHSNLKDSRLEPSEQTRLRLERKRARNRDAARKCRERKIGLIKSLEKDVAQLVEENKLLRNKLSRSRVEVERLKLFVVNHLEQDCPALSSTVA